MNKSHLFFDLIEFYIIMNKNLIKLHYYEKNIFYFRKGFYSYNKSGTHPLIYSQVSEKKKKPKKRTS